MRLLILLPILLLAVTTSAGPISIENSLVITKDVNATTNFDLIVQGNLTSVDHTLLVSEQPRIITDEQELILDADLAEATPEVNILTPNSSHNITVGQSVRLECRTDQPDAAVEWTKGKECLVVANLLVNNNYTNKYTFDEFATTNFDLTVNSAEPRDSGVYRCTLIQGNLTSVDHTLLVSEKPRIISLTASDSGRPREGTDLVLTCATRGVPEPEIIWSMQENFTNHLAGPSISNRKLTENDGVFGHNTVTIRNVKKEQSGWYYCYVLSPAGEDTKAVFVSVQGKPRVHLPRTWVNSAINVEAFLQCSVHDEQPVQITWSLNGNPLTSHGNVTISTLGPHSNLTVVPTSDADFGSYTCRADNDFGYHSKSINVVETPVIEDFYADGAKVTFRVHSHQALKEINLQLREVNSNQWDSKDVSLPEERHHEYEITYMIENLQPNKYEAILKVRNTKGWSQGASTIIEIAGQQELIKEAGLVYRGNAGINRPATVLLPTVLMYLLVRML